MLYFGVFIVDQTASTAVSTTSNAHRAIKGDLETNGSTGSIWEIGGNAHKAARWIYNIFERNGECKF